MSSFWAGFVTGVGTCVAVAIVGLLLLYRLVIDSWKAGGDGTNGHV